MRATQTRAVVLVTLLAYLQQCAADLGGSVTRHETDTIMSMTCTNYERTFQGFMYARRLEDKLDTCVLPVRSLATCLLAHSI